jgi:hypothetical protein
MIAAPFTADDFAKWRFQRDAIHFNGGSVFFGWGHRCVDQPRLLVIDKYFKKDRSTKRSYLVDGKTACETLDEALAALAGAPKLSEEERRLLDELPLNDWFVPEKRWPYQALADAGMIEWGRKGDKVACRRRLT